MSDPQGSPRTDEMIGDEALDWLALLRSSPSARDQENFKTWYAADGRHADIYDALLDGWDVMARMRRPETDRPHAQRGSDPSDKGAFKLLALAAVICLLLAAFGFYRAGFLGLGPERPAEMASQVGEIRTVALPDGSKIILDTNSFVAIQYSGSERRLILERGRARFDVAHDADRPFIVGTHAGEVIAHGTVFDVTVKGQRTSVALLKGSVEVRHIGRGGHGRFLKPGQKIAIAPSVPATSPVPSADEESRWPSGMLSYQNAKLSDVIADANRYALHPIRLGDASIGALRFTGTFKAQDTARLARLLAETLSLNLTRDPGGGFVLSMH
jgi:transmembrane sensor